ncbi:WD40-repeat-containing domain protein [Lipomyces tetrasporus]|uniref:methylated diphthine methylhydrolase n=1 Tax=Lipomyces tetrasporus TaxID=54092 RepID=A0AAD7QPY2_9ASCO|nr:WD40-repeat-containing domain protein [Lipomyces tetrasporus]KAJ8098811.1 WD40-repeat-containing domain protein [Lipomyces tetrasporus]
MVHISLASSTLTQLPPCALAFHPSDSRFVVVGTYKLEQDGCRHGALQVYECDGGKLKLCNTIESQDSSILDLKFSPHDCSLLASTHSTGKVCLWRVSLSGEHGIDVDLISACEITDSSDTLVLSVCFSPIDPAVISVTLSSGEWRLCSISSESSVATVQVQKKFMAHSLEAWTSAFSSNGSMLFSGGDDSCLSAHDLRAGMQVWQDRRSHGAGVTSILSFPYNESQIWTGSYDEKLRVWDLRGAHRKGSVVNELSLGGGVWRLTHHPKLAEKLVLSCCMHGGARLINASDELSDSSVVGIITDGHESMVYGGDWSSDTGYLATCSFYDRKLNLWSYR